MSLTSISITNIVQVGGWVGGWVVHKVIIVSVRVLYVGFSISLVLVFRFWVFRFSGFWVFGFSGYKVFGFQVFWTGRDARFFGRDGTGRDAELDNKCNKI